jgi:hypothetical protein
MRASIFGAILLVPCDNVQRNTMGMGSQILADSHMHQVSCDGVAVCVVCEETRTKSDLIQEGSCGIKEALRAQRNCSYER